MTDTLRASAFHARTAGANRTNIWITRNGVTLPATYTDTNEEAIAARTRVGITDLGARRQMTCDGPRVTEFLQHLLTRDVSVLSPSHAMKALWLADGGGVRGAGVAARFGKESFWLLSAAPDAAWIGEAAALFDVAVRDMSEERNGLAIVGPHAAATLDAAGVQSNLQPLAFRKVIWRGQECLLSRFGEHGGYELWCGFDDALAAWDRIMQVGAAYGIEPLGAAAMDVLDIEAGIPRPFRDYIPARTGDALQPLPRPLGLDSLIDREHRAFNGRAALLKSAQLASRRLMGVEIDSDQAAPHTPLINGTRIAGHTLSSVYSPTLRRAIALAQVDEDDAKPGKRLSLMLPPSLESPELRVAGATIVKLPFLAQTDPPPG
jgi:aminomethyltransferase